MTRRVFMMLLGGAMCIAACGAEPSPTAMPTQAPVQAVTLVPTATDTAQPTVTPTQLTATPTITPTLDPNLTLTPPLVTIEPVFGTNMEAPVNITLPEGWEVITTNSALPLPEGETFTLLPFAAYRGPVAGGTGTITLIWGFQNVVSGFPIQGTPAAVDLWSDGLRLLLFALLEPDCSVGRDPRQDYPVGAYAAVGGAFWAVDCGESLADDDIPPSPDIQGWFAGFKEQGINFMFYAYVEPREAITVAAPELQAILDTIVIDFTKLERSMGSTPAP